MYIWYYNRQGMEAGIYFNRNYLSESRFGIERIRTGLIRHGIGCKVIDGFSDLDGLDVLFVLGGDGTILTIASECAARNIKIIGINYGHMGFLTEFEPDKSDDVIELLSEGNYCIQKRSMLKAELNGQFYYALNDIVIERSTIGVQYSNTVNLHAMIDGSTVDNFSADGLIISTPTGSTAYSLSAGGSILAPELDAFILTPVCAHSLHSRPIVYNNRSVLKVNPIGSRAPIAVIVDGRIVGDIKESDIIVITKAERAVEFITVDKKNFFNKLFIKLNIWSK